MPKKSTLAPHVCAQCGGEFIAHTTANRLYCSAACYWQARRKPPASPNATCVVCGAAFFRHPTKLGPYCSRACSSKAAMRKEQRTCGHCGKTFEVVPSSTQRFCSNLCGHQNPHNKGTRITYGEHVCVICGKAFTQTRREASGLYCSKRCSQKGNGINSRQRIEKTCIVCGKTFEVYPSLNHVEHCSNACADKTRSVAHTGPRNPFWARVEMHCEICGKTCLVKRCLIGRFRACSRRCAALIGQKQQPRISSIERIMAAQFEKARLSPVPQFILGHYSLDFAFPDHRVAVEVDGTYWHSLPKSKRVDAAKNSYLRNRGWLLVRLPEADVKRDPVACLRRVLAALNAPQDQMMLFPL